MERDKILHGWFGLFFATIATVITYDYTANLLHAFLIGALTALIIGILKELFDEYLSEYFAKILPRFFNKSKWSWLDIVATEIGGLGGATLGILIIIILE